jgi:hypothetical protein
LGEVDVKWRVLRDLALVGGKLRHACGMICTLHFNKPIQGKHRNNFSNMIKTYFDGINDLTVLPEIKYTHTDEFGEFKAINYDKAALEQIKESKDFEILYYLEQTDKVAENGLPMFEGKIITNFNISKNEVYKKLKTVLREKKDQHRSSGFDHKVIFLDSESITELYFGMFAGGRLFDPEEIWRVYTSLNLDCIVCIILRDYRRSKPEFYTVTFQTDRLANDAKVLLGAFKD